MAENPRESNGIITESQLAQKITSEYLAKMHAGECVIPARELTSDNGYTVGVDVAKPGSDRTAITLRLDVDVSDALTGLKALRREADRAVAALKALEEARRETSEWDRYIAAVREIAGEHYDERPINHRVYLAIRERQPYEIIEYRRGEGVTTSIAAAALAFEHVIAVVPNEWTREMFVKRFGVPFVYTESEAKRREIYRDVRVVLIDQGAHVSKITYVPDGVAVVNFVAIDDLPVRPEVSE
jgi:hypothetical protein